MLHKSPFTLIKSAYGSKTNMLEYHKAKFRYYLGSYRVFKNINWDKVDRLVFVCKGNICRSPYAEAISKRIFPNTVSYGLEASNGDFANPDAIKNSCIRGVDISMHKSSKLTAEQVLPGDLLVAFEPEQGFEILRLINGVRAQTTILGIWSQNISPDIPDPYNCSDEYFQTCYELIDRNCHEILTKKLTF